MILWFWYQIFCHWKDFPHFIFPDYVYRQNSIFFSFLQEKARGQFAVNDQSKRSGLWDHKPSSAVRAALPGGPSHPASLIAGLRMRFLNFWGVEIAAEERQHTSPLDKERPYKLNFLNNQSSNLHPMRKTITRIFLIQILIWANMLRGVEEYTGRQQCIFMVANTKPSSLTSASLHIKNKCHQQALKNKQEPEIKYRHCHFKINSLGWVPLKIKPIKGFLWGNLYARGTNRLQNLELACSPELIA